MNDDEVVAEFTIDFDPAMESAGAVQTLYHNLDPIFRAQIEAAEAVVEAVRKNGHDPGCRRFTAELFPEYNPVKCNCPMSAVAAYDRIKEAARDD